MKKRAVILTGILVCAAVAAVAGIPQQAIITEIRHVVSASQDEGETEDADTDNNADGTDSEDADDVLAQAQTKNAQ